jgi:putative oxidoreductase
MSGNSPALFIPALGGLYAALRPLAYPIVRVTAGLFLMPHGAQKLFGLWGGNINNVIAGFGRMGLEPAAPLAYLVAVTEFFGGLCIALGLFTRFWAAGGVILMSVIAFKAHLPRGWFGNGAEFPTMWLMLMIVVLIRGAGEFSLDKRIGKEL